jgi:phosphoglycerate dehydrogenase-like enzyme
MKLKKAAFFCNSPEAMSSVYRDGRRQRIEQLTDCYSEVISDQNFSAHSAALREVEVIFSTWGMPVLTRADLDCLPRLRAVFYAAGTVRPFAQPFVERGISVCSAWHANAIPVAEFTVAQILLSNKGYFRNVRENRVELDERIPFRGPGNFELTVGLLGAGQIGRKVIELLQPFSLRVVVFDPFLAEEAAGQLGVEKVSLEEAFQRGFVVSNHLANLAATKELIKGVHFRSMRRNATFINTGRGATVAQNEMAEVLQARPDLTALLDVISHEGCDRVSAEALFSLPNVSISSHIAGSQGCEVVRLADYMIEEFNAWQSGLPLRYAVTAPMMASLA